MDLKYSYWAAAAEEQELNGVLTGHSIDNAIEWSERGPRVHFSPTSVVAVWRQTAIDDFAQPVAIVCPADEQRRMFGRYSQLRSDLAPLTAWCHFLTPSQFQDIKSLSRPADLDGWEACWTGVVVAEAFLLAERSLAKLRFPACQATQTFAIARTLALWGEDEVSEALSRFETAQRLLRQREQGIMRLKTDLEPIWACLIAVSKGIDPYRYSELAPIVESLRRLRRFRESKHSNEAVAFVDPLISAVPEVQALYDLESLTPEQRLQQFDLIVDTLRRESSDNVLRRTALSLLAGYFSTIAAGGAPSLSLTETHAAQWPAITAWAYLLGGVAERVVWTSAFDGLGRLVARELMRPLRLDEAPTCDFSIEEAQVLVDPKLAEPFVHLRIKQARLLSVALLPGVNVSVPLPDSATLDTRKPEAAGETRKATSRGRGGSELEEEQLAILADGLWPHLSARIQQIVTSLVEKRAESVRAGKSKKKQAGLKEQEKLWSRD